MFKIRNKYLYFIGFIIIVFQFACNKPCNYTYYNFSQEFMNYAGVFKTGNWWVYENISHTKTDSLYFTSATRSSWVEFNCNKYAEIHAEMKAKYILNGQLSLDVYKYSKCCKDFFDIVGSTGNFCVYEYDVNTNIFTQGGGKSVMIKIDTTINNVMYLNCIFDTLTYKIHAPNVGIISYIVYSTIPDTFLLKRYYVQ